jgi:LCP family protein required for cell wall assembly
MHKDFKRRGRRQSASVDGFVSYVPDRREHTNLKQGGLQAPLGNFRRADGLHSEQLTQKYQGIEPVQVDAPEPELSQPIVEASEPEPQAKRRWLFRRRKIGAERAKKRYFKTIAVGTLLFLVIGGLGTAGYLGYKAYTKLHNVFKDDGTTAAALSKEVLPSQLKGEGDGRVNILLLGRGGANHPGGNLTDTILVASIDPVQNEAALLSIPRDFYVNFRGTYTKINAVFEYGQQASKAKDDAGKEKDGIAAIDEKLTQVIGIPMHYYAIVDFDAFKDVVNAVNGIDITLDDPIWDPNFDWQYGKNALKLPAGQVHLSGVQAMLLARSRNAHGGYGTGNDFERNANQRKMLIAIKEKVFTLGTFSNPAKISSLIDAVGNHVRTNISLDELRRMYDIGKNIDAGKVASIGFTDEPNNLITTGTRNNQSVVLPRAGDFDYTDIQAFVRNSLKDAFIKSEAAKISIYNGTSMSSLASTKAKVLKSYGYDVQTVANAPTKDYDKTVIVDRTNGTKKYTKHYLEQRFGVVAQATLPAGFEQETADFVIILGQNEVSTTQN